MRTCSGHLTLNPLTLELPQYGVPRPGALRHNIIFISFFLEISKQIFRLYGNKSKTCRPVFWPYGVKWLRNVASKIAQKLMSADVTWSLGFQGKRYKQASQQDTLVTCFIYTSAKQVINSSLRIIHLSVSPLAGLLYTKSLQTIAKKPCRITDLCSGKNPLNFGVNPTQNGFLS